MSAEHGGDMSRGEPTQWQPVELHRFAECGSDYCFDLGVPLSEYVPDGHPRLAIYVQEAAGHLDPNTNPGASYGWDFNDSSYEGEPSVRVSNAGY